ncbi:ABC transporter permease [Microbacterium sp. APC 3898]|uniref:ABC transporter permease n=2 Tax=Planococcus TaxID=1372 RepID=A0ABT7ZM12_9BACL|nr:MULTISPECIES: ABC transporter permease [Terrabacteria group]MBF6633375.1 ABC transporter permease [Planococcus sp. (in: firmicutes)]MBD8015304.1 ABC transporter permease [Planococcus wigleyi]MDN3428193.1 ABC transporter permease [Planococcus sp. APC 4016]MDN3439491.1 ABC transporter permease [Planococcus sp. APC 3900]MDN3498270.1 ABC transporter permease [Microbacterium sp. APC 3898]
MKKRYLIPTLIILSIVSLFVGVSSISVSDLLDFQSEETEIFLISRLPRLVAILLAGAGMSMAGLIMQQLSRNKFVSPTTAGTLDATRLGILVSMLLFANASMLEKMTVAFAFALAGTFLFMQILNRIKFKDAIFIPLVGLMFGNILSSITTFFAYRADVIQNMSAWLQGDFSMIMKGSYELLYISVPVFIIAYLYANRFTVAGMGEDFSKNLGMKYRSVVNIGLVLVALITATVVLTVGIIPFLGLIIPNIVSIFKGDHLQKTLPHTAMLGAIFLLVCDILGRVLIYPYEISISLMVGVIGSFIFLFLLFRRKAYA